MPGTPIHPSGTYRGLVNVLDICGVGRKKKSFVCVCVCDFLFFFSSSFFSCGSIKTESCTILPQGKKEANSFQYLRICFQAPSAFRDRAYPLSKKYIHILFVVLSKTLTAKEFIIGSVDSFSAVTYNRREAFLSRAGSDTTLIMQIVFVSA